VKKLSAIAAVLALILFSIPARAENEGMVTKTFELTLNGDVPEAETFQFGANAGGDAGVVGVFCGRSLKGTMVRKCVGDGAVYRETVEFPRGSTIRFVFTRVIGRDSDGAEDGIEVFHEGTETLDGDTTNGAYYTFGSISAAEAEHPETVTKTFRLRLNGNVPDGQLFYARYGVSGTDVGEAVYFCGPDLPDVDPCIGGGTFYAESVEIREGARVQYSFVRADSPEKSAMEEVFFRGEETMTSAMTNAAYYAFGADDVGDGGGADGEADVPDALPDTGGGARTGGMLPAALALRGAGRSVRPARR
jgi:hypothetical protein